MVKNYLVCSVRPISENWMGNDSSQLYLDYQEVYRLRLCKRTV
jgi:hypothetical protein